MTDKISQGGPTGKTRSARIWNGLVDLLEHHRNGALGKPPPHLAAPSNPSIVSVKNDTGDDLPRGSVLEFSDFALTDIAQDYFWFVGSVPDLTRPTWGILRQALPDEKVGDCQILGACIALVNVTNASHKFANLKVGENCSAKQLRWPGTHRPQT